MKIIGYQKDYCTATVKILRNCQKLCTACGVNFYYVTSKNDERLTDYYYHIDGTKDLLDRLHISSYNTPEEVKDLLLNRISEQQLKPLVPNVAEKIKIIKATIESKQWTSNGDALFCEIVGENDLAEQVRKNRAEVLEQKRLEEEEERQEREKRRLEAEEAARKKLVERIENIKAKILSEQSVTAEEFELIARDCNIALPIKLVGWLREYCHTILIQKRIDPPPYGSYFEYKYKTSYSYTKKHHTSMAIFKYADLVAEKIGL